MEGIVAQRVNTSDERDKDQVEQRENLAPKGLPGVAGYRGIVAGTGDDPDD